MSVVLCLVLNLVLNLIPYTRKYGLYWLDTLLLAGMVEERKGQLLGNYSS
jgi:hypothetical protein